MATALDARQYAAIRSVRQSEERALFARLARDRSAATRDLIAERFMPLARRLAGRCRQLDDIEDLEQVAASGEIAGISQMHVARLLRRALQRLQANAAQTSAGVTSSGGRGRTGGGR